MTFGWELPERQSRQHCLWDGCDGARASKAGRYCVAHRAMWNLWNRSKSELTLTEWSRCVSHRRVDQDGYASVIADNRWQREHRVVMESLLVRPLRDGENVHHRNGIRDDNTPENLELWVVSQPYGQRPIDLAVWTVKNYPELVREALSVSI